MRTFALICLCSWFMVLSGCKTYHGLDSHVNTWPNCVASCKTALNTCHAVCHDNDAACELAAKQSTKRFFCRYKHEQAVKGAIVARELNSYYDPLQCRKTTCDCWSDYRVCRAACTGKIHKRLETPVDDRF